MSAIPPPSLSPPPSEGGFLGWFLVVSGAVVLFLTLGCVVVIGQGNLFALVIGAPTLLLGGLLVWLGMRRFNR